MGHGGDVGPFALRHPLQVIISKVNALVSELRSGGPMKPGSKEAAQAEAAALGGAADGAASASASAAAKQKLTSAKPEEVKAEAAAKKLSSSSGRTLTITERYFAKPSDIFECFVVDGKVRA
jgi:hypothetical protein